MLTGLTGMVCPSLNMPSWLRWWNLLYSTAWLISHCWNLIGNAWEWDRARSILKRKIEVLLPGGGLGARQRKIANIHYDLIIIIKDMIMENHDCWACSSGTQALWMVSGEDALWVLSPLSAQAQIAWLPHFITKHVFTTQHLCILFPLNGIIFSSLCIKEFLLYVLNNISSKRSPLTALKKNSMFLLLKSIPGVDRIWPVGQIRPQPLLGFVNNVLEHSQVHLYCLWLLSPSNSRAE